VRPLLFRAPAGLADGLAQKEQRYVLDRTIRPWDLATEAPVVPPLPDVRAPEIRLGTSDAGSVQIAVT